MEGAEDAIAVDAYGMEASERDRSDDAAEGRFEEAEKIVYIGGGVEICDGVVEVWGEVWSEV